MRWDDVIPAVVAALRADSALVTALGSTAAIFAASDSTTVKVPSVTWTMVADVEEEVWNPILVQFDLFAANWAAMAVIEKRMRVLLHKNLTQTLGGVRMWTELVDARTGDVADEMNPGLVFRQLDVRFTPARLKYEP